MKAITALLLVLLLGACGTRDASQSEIADEIGKALAQRLAEPLERASATGEADPEHEILSDAVEMAMAELPLLDGVDRILPSSSGSHYEDEYVSLHIEFVVVPAGDDPFCMTFAADSTGQVVSNPADGDPLNRCGDVAPARLEQP